MSLFFIIYKTREKPNNFALSFQFYLILIYLLFNFFKTLFFSFKTLLYEFYKVFKDIEKFFNK